MLLLGVYLNLQRLYLTCIEYLDNMALRIKARSSGGVINYLFNGLQSKPPMLNHSGVISSYATSYHSNDKGQEGSKRAVDWKVAAITFGTAVGFTVTCMHRLWKKKYLLAEENTAPGIFNKENRQEANESIICTVYNSNLGCLTYL